MRKNHDAVYTILRTGDIVYVVHFLHVPGSMERPSRLTHQSVK